MYKIFIDGSAGTTGLRIRERLADRPELELMILPEELRKDTAARAEMLNNCDISFLCLPDAAAIEAVSLITNPDTVVIDTSTAHRTADGWTYGMPELTGLREQIKTATRIANPGCHASGFIALVRPLVELGILGADSTLSCFSLTGYSGGGKKMIAEYESADRDPLLDAPRIYALPQAHKHLPEMAKLCGLDKEPVFSPIVASYYSGMEVSVTVTRDMISCSLDDIRTAYKDYYKSGLIRYDDSTESGFISAAAFSGRDDMIVAAFGNDDRITLISRFDNLGKGASGAAIQNMNIRLGLDEATGLVI
ncbi:MAG: N-acetyl-gamma-glutamyl-phosphate reductase [Ruminococcus sp.]|uniref:N-acetyl-gamma-glutamyl-phosphate reductase n=1 Tax=Ruminococcus sp. TaxID=41978 RepID=UPI00287349A1|nr:N-acetyl-gamma-glutamyl-phosphate reductase [Ruminococcus sp.]MBQ3284607.1 N-acetyl-gamma-glutamyl-phosphate reductase [Ruminococcus sp.]MBQ9515193.1 N-acetyl-gamma-glutamyl-phosphate reductase [Ruminococcus sp.]